MSGEMLKAAMASAANRWSDTKAQLAETLGQFRESRLYVQIVLSAVLVGVTGLVALLPVGPLARAKEALTWVATHDYDFAGQLRRANGWATDRGGWGKAFSGLWAAGVERARGWVELPGPERSPGMPPSQAAPQQPEAEPEPEPPANEISSGKPVMPVNGAMLFGFGWPPPGSGDQFHHGIDLMADRGAKVMAILDGTVVRVMSDEKLGQIVEIQHGNILAVYAQVEGVAVRAGQQVRQRQEIAAVGPSVGLEKSEPPHLHFEVRTLPERHSVDPASFLGLGGSKL